MGRKDSNRILKSVTADSILLNGGINYDTNDAPMEAQANDSGIYAILQNKDDSGTTGKQKARLRWVSAAGERYADVSGDVGDNELSFYTAEDDPTDGGEVSLQKRLDLHGGQKVTTQRFANTQTVEILNRDNSFTELLLSPDDGNVSQVAFSVDGSRNAEWIIRRNSGGNLRVRDDNAGNDYIEFDQANTDIRPRQPINLKDSIMGLREVSNASASDLGSGEWTFDDDRGGTGNSAWLFKDSGGTVHYWDADGTL